MYCNPVQVRTKQQLKEDAKAVGKAAKASEQQAVRPMPLAKYKAPGKAMKRAKPKASKSKVDVLYDMYQKGRNKT